MGCGSELFLQTGKDNNADHTAEIAYKIVQIDTVQRTVDLLQNGGSVDGCECDLFVVYIKVSGTCRNKEYYDADTE